MEFKPSEAVYWDSDEKLRLLAESKNSPDPEKAIALYKAISDLSEEIWSAGWLHGCESIFWKQVLSEKDRVPEYLGELECIKHLAHECDGWWVNNEELAFHRLAEWENIYKGAIA